MIVKAGRHLDQTIAAADVILPYHSYAMIIITPIFASKRCLNDRLKVNGKERRKLLEAFGTQLMCMCMC